MSHTSLLHICYDTWCHFAVLCMCTCACFTICTMQAPPSVPCMLHHLCHASFTICAMHASPFPFIQRTCMNAWCRSPVMCGLSYFHGTRSYFCTTATLLLCYTCCIIFVHISAHLYWSYFCTPLLMPICHATTYAMHICVLQLQADLPALEHTLLAYHPYHLTPFLCNTLSALLA